METKVCSECKQEKAIAEYNKKLKKYQPCCRDCQKEKQKTYYQANKEKVLSRNDAYYQANKEKVLAQKRQYQKEHAEHIKKRNKLFWEKNKQALMERHRQWKANNPGWVRSRGRIHCAQYKARKKELESHFTLEQWEKTKEFFSNQCAYCGKQIELTQDHFVPVAKGGDYTINNIIPACQPCNSSKHMRDFESWYPEQWSYSKKRENKIYKYLNIKGGMQQLQIGL